VVGRPAPKANRCPPVAPPRRPPQRGSARRGAARRPRGFAAVRENLAHSAGRGDEGEEAHRGVTAGTAQGKTKFQCRLMREARYAETKNCIDARQQHGPEIAGGGAVGRCVQCAGGVRRRWHGHRRQRGDGGAPGGRAAPVRRSSGGGGLAVVAPGRRSCRSVRAASAPRRGVCRGAAWRGRRPDARRRRYCWIRKIKDKRITPADALAALRQLTSRTHYGT
jgi:hypothetical protein